MKSITSCFGCILLCLFVSGAVYASTTVSMRSYLAPRTADKILVAKYPSAKFFTLDTSKIASLFRRHSRISITDVQCASSHEPITIHLKPSRSPFSSKTKVVIATTSGDVVRSVPELLVFRGMIEGQPKSKVILTYSGGRLLCSIQPESGAAEILSVVRTTDDETHYMIIPEYELLSAEKFSPFNCINESVPDRFGTLTPINELLAASDKNPKRSTPQWELATKSLLEVEVAVEADNEFFKAAGNTEAKTLGYIGSLFAMVSMIFENEAHIVISIPWVKIWSTDDPYDVNGNAYALPDTVRSYWRKNYSNIERDIAHVMTSVSYGGGGFGFYSLCDKNNSFSVSSPQTGHTYPGFAFTYDTYIISHEIGHNFGLPHSHSCYWEPPLDTCFTTDDPNSSLRLNDACYSLPIIAQKNSGTLMSYCANSNYILSGENFTEYKVDMTFGERVDTVLRTNAEKAPCITSLAEPTLILTFPQGGEVFKADTTIVITWTYSGDIANVGFQYSTNGGETWSAPQPILTPAPLGMIGWKIPDVNSTQMLLRIYSADDENVADTNVLYFTVKGTEVVERNDGAIPNTFTLDQNYPNPVNGRETIIGFGLPHRANVSLNIYNEIGEHVAELVNGNLDGGRYFVSLNTKHFASGLYTITLAAEHTTLFSKMSVVK